MYIKDIFETKNEEKYGYNIYLGVPPSKKDLDTIYNTHKKIDKQSQKICLSDLINYIKDNKDTNVVTGLEVNGEIYPLLLENKNNEIIIKIMGDNNIPNDVLKRFLNDIEEHSLQKVSVEYFDVLNCWKNFEIKKNII